MNRNLVSTTVIGIAIAVAGVAPLQAGPAPTAPGYVIAEVEVTDMAKMQEYGAQVPATLAPFNHRYVIRGGKTTALEGEPPKGIVVIAFDSVEKARAWYESPAYSAIRPLRQAAAKSRIFVAEGFVPK